MSSRSLTDEPLEMDGSLDMQRQPPEERPRQRDALSDVCMSDRLVPSRGTCCSEVGNLKLERDENWAPQNNYHEVLSQNVLGKESLSNVKVLSYQHKPKFQDPMKNELQVIYSCNRDAATKLKPSKLDRVVPKAAAKVLDAPGIVDDFYIHPLDWSNRGSVAIALADLVYLYEPSSGESVKLAQLPESAGDVTTLRWTTDGAHLSVGTSCGDLQIWDCSKQRQIRTLRGHSGRIGAQAWHEHVLSSGAMDAEIHQHDVRVKDHLVARLAGVHTDLICGLDYSSDGILASGANDNTVCIWDCTNQNPLHTFTEHTAAVKAVRWCPWQRNMLATGGGSADRQLCLWNASSGRLLMSAGAGSQVTGIVWSRQERELLTSHGYSRNQLSLWKYPALVKVADIEGHTDRILGICPSPDGSFVCSTSADETLRFWQVFSPATSEKQGLKRDIGTRSTMLKTIR
eukprot:TRINITY_DN18496_c0_g1_i1.p1 TRINITY_DN18496_c0_g1~~TRINITY_DN18496_c0_g1_i1.p1  ORF type:complete len:457 (-),score=69.10 TRINITY_DN18496_c0_g1_i1:849-2219(-)